MQKSNTIWVIISNFLVASFSGKSRFPLVSFPNGLKAPFTRWGHWMPLGKGMGYGWEGGV